MAHAKQVQTFDELLAFARSYNEETMQPALSDSIVVEKASSAWRYEALGLNTFGQRAIIIPQKLDKSPADAIYLYSRLQRQFFCADEFPMPKDYGKPFDMGWRRLANATKALIEAGVIKRVRRGGRFEGDAATYAWVKKRGRERV